MLVYQRVYHDTPFPIALSNLQVLIHTQGCPILIHVPSVIIHVVGKSPNWVPEASNEPPSGASPSLHPSPVASRALAARCGNISWGAGETYLFFGQFWHLGKHGKRMKKAHQCLSSDQICLRYVEVLFSVGLVAQRSSGDRVICSLHRHVGIQYGTLVYSVKEMQPDFPLCSKGASLHSMLTMFAPPSPCLHVEILGK